jgi:peroxiredoxin
MRLLRARPLQFMGLVSYSLYLWHEPLMLSLQKHHILYFKDPVAWPLSVAALIAIGLFVAWLSYHLIEVPGQNLRRLLQIHRPRSAKRSWRSGELEVRRGTELSTLPSLRAEDGSVVELGALFAGGRPLVAFVHPGNHDEGGLRTGCVTEARAYAESAFVFDALGVDVVGVSSQPPEAQRAFSEREQLPFPMLSDAGGDFSAAAGVPLWRDDGGGVFPERVTLIIDRFGAIQEALSADIPPVARPGVAAARIEALLGARPPLEVTHAQPIES